MSATITHDPCCSSHRVPMDCKRYRRTHFVEVGNCCAEWGAKQTAREELARLIVEGQEKWRTPLEAADAILASLNLTEWRETVTEWQFLHPEVGDWAGTSEASAMYLSSEHGYFIRSRQVTAWEQP